MRNSANSVAKIIFNCIPCHKMKKKNYTANCMLSEGIIKLLKDYRRTQAEKTTFIAGAFHNYYVQNTLSILNMHKYVA